MLITVAARAHGAVSSPSNPSAHLLRFVAGARHGIMGWAERRRQLRALSELDEHLLQDVGLSRDDVRRACAQIF